MDSPKPWSRAQKRVERREEVLLVAAVELSGAVELTDAVGALMVLLAVIVELSAVGGAVTVVAFPGRLRAGSAVVVLSGGGATTGTPEVDAGGGRAAHAAGAVVRLIDIRY